MRNRKTAQKPQTVEAAGETEAQELVVLAGRGSYPMGVLGVVLSGLFLCLAVVSEFFGEVLWLFLLGIGGLGGLVVLSALLALHGCRFRLVLSQNGCTRTDCFGRTTAFAPEEILRVEERGWMLRGNQPTVKSLVLIGKGEKVLGKVSSASGQVSQATKLFKRWAVPIKPPLWPWSPPADGSVPDWQQGEAAPWEFRHIKQLKLCTRVGMWTVIVLGILLYFFSTTDLRPAALFWGLTPLGVFGLYWAFPRLFVWEMPGGAPKRWKATHLALPSILIFVLFLMGYPIINTISFPVLWPPALFCIAVFLLLLLPSLGRTPRNPRPAGGMGLMIVCIAVFSFFATYLVNYGLRFQEKEHIPAFVVSSTYSSGKNGGYHLTVRDSTGEKRQFEVSRSLYEDVKDGGMVTVCRKVSVFGIVMDAVHG